MKVGAGLFSQWADAASYRQVNVNGGPVCIQKVYRTKCKFSSSSSTGVPQLPVKAPRLCYTPFLASVINNFLKLITLLRRGYSPTTKLRRDKLAGETRGVQTATFRCRVSSPFLSSQEISSTIRYFKHYFFGDSCNA